jgi:hypothetical protein
VYLAYNLCELGELDVELLVRGWLARGGFLPCTKSGASSRVLARMHRRSSQTFLLKKGNNFPLTSNGDLDFLREQHARRLALDREARRVRSTARSEVTGQSEGKADDNADGNAVEAGKEEEEDKRKGDIADADDAAAAAKANTGAVNNTHLGPVLSGSDSDGRFVQYKDTDGAMNRYCIPVSASRGEVPFIEVYAEEGTVEEGTAKMQFQGKVAVLELHVTPDVTCLVEDANWEASVPVADSHQTQLAAALTELCGTYRKDTATKFKVVALAGGQATAK